MTLTHDLKFDVPALAALRGGAGYVGAMGASRPTASAARLAEEGFAPALARIRTPIGLDIGSNSPGDRGRDLAEMLAVARGATRVRSASGVVHDDTRARLVAGRRR